MHARLRPLAATALGLALILSTAAFAPPGGPQQATVMSRNLYLGADLTPVIASAYPHPLLENAWATWQTVVASDPAGRMAAVADEIRANHPDLVGLQEVGLWRTQTPADGPLTPATDVAYDFLALLLDALHARGLDYTAVSSTTNFDGEVPTIMNMDVRYTDRDVILARAGVEASNPMHGNFSVTLPLPNPLGGTLNSARGWASVDATVRNTSFRFVDTHPEAYGPDVIRTAQVGELAAGPLATTMPTVLVGDLNSVPTSAAVGVLVSVGMTDAFSGPGPGFTCCEDGLLANVQPTLDQRIDYVMWRGGFSVADFHLVGNTVGDRMSNGRWPSDHAGVVATLMQAG
jgi:endonuclease/exonuclease/phosphatase family metal-dependent hydrolase